jgi:F-type H+-transporting ATPase subunit delta
MVNTVSLQYAKALFDLGQAKIDKIVEYHQQLIVIQKSIENDSMFQQVLNHPKISKSEKKDIFRSVFLEMVDPNVLYFIYVLVDNNRIDILVDVIDAFQYLIDQQNNIKHVTVFSKIALTDRELEQLREKLSDKVNSLVELSNVIDQSISGGIRLEYDGYILDDTLTSKLNRLKEVLKSK